MSSCELRVLYHFPNTFHARYHNPTNGFQTIIYIGYKIFMQVILCDAILINFPRGDGVRQYIPVCFAQWSWQDTNRLMRGCFAKCAIIYGIARKIGIRLCCDFRCYDSIISFNGPIWRIHPFSSVGCTITRTIPWSPPYQWSEWKTWVNISDNQAQQNTTERCNWDIFP